MSICEDALREIAETFVGDRGQLFPYMKGPQIVAFFNQHFGYRDEYQWGGAPTRWVYARDKISEVFSSGLTDKFFSTVLGYRYMMRTFGCGETGARQRAEDARSEFSRILRSEGYELSGTNGSFSLVRTDDDMVLIGEGGFACAYLQKSTGLVVKKLKADSALDRGCRHRFKREYSIMKSLSSAPGVLRVFNFDEDSSSYTMEAGERTLSDFMKEPLADNVKTAILTQVLSALSRIHDSEIVHRDISPNNIFILHGEVKIADFGLGKNLDTLASYQTSDTNNYGQYFYCSPEQLLYLKDGDKRSDVFSLGRLINFVMAGHPMRDAHQLRSVVEKATSQDPANRYQDAGELLAAFRRKLDIVADESCQKAIVEKVGNGILDDEVEGWILDTPSSLLCRNVLSVSGLPGVLSRFACSGNDRAAFVIDSISEGLVEACRSSFEANDPFANIAYVIVRSSASFDVRERACVVLAYIANFVNRYSAQDLVNSAIEKGIDPMLEDVLNSCPSKPSFS